MSHSPQTEVEWTTKAHGYEGALHRLNTDRNNLAFPKYQRNAANRNHAKIVRQLTDKRLMGMRERLMKAAAAGDNYQMAKIQMCMRDYLGEDKETGLYEQDKA